MMQGIYVVKDEKVGFLQVMQDTNDATAMRNFEFAVTKADSMYAANKADLAQKSNKYLSRYYP